MAGAIQPQPGLSNHSQEYLKKLQPGLSNHGGAYITTAGAIQLWPELSHHSHSWDYPTVAGTVQL